MSQTSPQILISVSGPDKPGITAGLVGLISEMGANLLDIEQVVTRSLLSLSMIVSLDPGKKSQDLIKELLFKAHELGIQVRFDILEEKAFDKLAQRQSYVITCLGDEVNAKVIAKLSLLLFEEGINIEKIGKLTEEKLNCIEMIINAEKTIHPRDMTKKLLHLNAEFGVDISVQKETLFRRAKRLIVMDMDSTLVQMEGIDELAKEAGVGLKVAEITERAMNGELNFKEALRERVRLLKGLPEETLQKVYSRIPFTPGARELIRILQKMGYKTAVLSGGFSYFTDRLKKELNLDYAYSNQLEIINGKLTGEVVGEIVDGLKKSDLLEEIAAKEGISLDQAIAIGDGANDLMMIGKAGLGIAFNAKPKVRAAAQHSITRKNLDSILYLLGISDKDIAQLN
ncbi:MAG: phosphoserine phosphatase SerB [Nitrospirae bacterium]|nr:phosphoserine phosphatase SerB [Nitrospirota bacterium]MBI3594688.1 phosphoserine phosphatase SerB [Nitrospirota bacterium]